MPLLLMATAGLAALAADAARPAPVVRVRATTAVAPCVRAAARAYETPGRRVVVETGALADPAGADVLVGAAAELARALEGGAAVLDSDAKVARLPWMLVVPSGNPHGIARLADVERAGVEVWVAGGPAAHEARRALRAVAPDRAREAEGGAVPRGAAATLVPACLAGEGDRLPVEVPDLVVEAAVSAHAVRPDAARDFVAYLASPAGARSFAVRP
jgi:hypothetical protein